MRYSENEETILVGEFEPDKNIKIKILELKSDQFIGLNTNDCVESDKVPGIYTFDTRHIDKSTVPEYSNLLYIMYDEEGYQYLGKFVYGGWLDNIEVEANVDLKPIEDKLDMHDLEVNDKLDIINARIT